jgi:D-alanyl-lipoteichoic acid acyltransferase DltB (MBOAT superfamily)
MELFSLKTCLGLGAAVLGFRLIPDSKRPLFLLLLSLFAFVYFAGARDFALFLACLSLASVAAWLGSYRLACFSVAVLLAHLVFWKASSQWGHSPMIPLGVSFYTLHLVGYLIDFARGNAPIVKPLSFSLFGSFFPYLLAGPIVRWRMWEVQTKVWKLPDVSQVGTGIFRISYGLTKKACLADPCGTWVDTFFHDPSLFSSSAAWIAALAFTVQIWADFSAYSDIAVGCGRLFGIELPENFRSPYLATSLTDFWHRWHITLGAWLKDYLYKPLLGETANGMRRSFSLFGVVMASALWHGVSAGFALWGVWHGLLLCVEKAAFSERRQRLRLPSALKLLGVQASVAVGWMAFRSPDGATILKVGESLTGMGLGKEGPTFLVSAACFVTLGLQALEKWFAAPTPLALRYGRTYQLILGILSGGGIALVYLTRVSLAPPTNFIYFRF